MAPEFRFFSSIRSRLTLLVSVCIFPALLMAVALLAHDYEREREELRDNAVITARTIISLVDQQVFGINATLRALATSPALGQGDIKNFYQQALAVLGSQPIRNITLMSPAGQEVVNTLRPFGVRLPNIPSDILSPLANGNGPVISGIVRGKVDGKMELSICVPVRIKEIHFYNLCAVLVPEHLARLISQQQLPASWIVAVLDSKGTIIARSHEMDRYVGSPAAKDLRDAMVFDNAGWFEGQTSEGIAVLAAFSRSTITNWEVAIGIPSDMIADRAKEKLRWLVAATLLLLSLSAIAAHLVGRGIAQALHGLVEPALMLGTGKELRVPRLHLLEANEVAKALKQAAAMLSDAQYQASHDALTGLPNRVFFNNFAANQAAACKRNPSDFCVLYIDLDGFKPVNDLHGHSVGDAVLSEVGRRLKGNVRESDVAARLGGDEFGVVLVGVSSEAARKVANKLIHVLSIPYEIEKITAQISASVGIAGNREAAEQGIDILHLADTAMYLAKAAGKGRVICASGMELD